MSSREFTHWRAYYALEPFGFEIDNFRMGQICSAVVNVAPRGKHAKAVTPSMFYPTSKDSRAGLTPEQAEHLRKKRERDKRNGNSRNRHR